MFQIGQKVFCYDKDYPLPLKGTVVEHEPEHKDKVEYVHVQCEWDIDGYFEILRVFASLDEWKEYAIKMRRDADKVNLKIEENQNRIFEGIAREYLGIQTLEPSHKVELDCHHLHVSSIKKALKKAFELGREIE